MEEIYTWIAANMDYWVVTLFMAIESSFIPFPSEVVIIPAAYIAINQGTMTIPMIIVSGTVGAIIGALVNYYLALWLGRPIIYKFSDTKLSHMLLIDRDGVEKAEKYFADHGAVGTFVGRLIPVIRQLISIPAGLAKLKMTTFLFFTGLGACIWNAVLAILGAVLGKSMPEEVLIEKVEQYSGYVKIVIAVVILAGLAYYLKKVIEANKRTALRNKK